MTLPLPSPASDIKLAVGAVVLVAVIGVIGYLGYTKSLLETEIAQDETLLAEYKDQNDNWKTKTEAANQAIKSLQDEVAASTQAVAAAQKSATAVQAQHENSAKVIESASPQGNDCDDAKKLLNSYFLRNRK